MTLYQHDGFQNYVHLLTGSNKIQQESANIVSFGKTAIYCASEVDMERIRILDRAENSSTISRVDLSDYSERYQKNEAESDYEYCVSVNFTLAK